MEQRAYLMAAMGKITKGRSWPVTSSEHYRFDESGGYRGLLTGKRDGRFGRLGEVASVRFVELQFVETMIA